MSFSKWVKQKGKSPENLPLAALYKLWIERASEIIKERDIKLKQPPKERKALLDALDQVLSVLQGSDAEDAGGSGSAGGGKSSPKQEPPQPYAGQGEYGETGLRSEIPKFSYWDELHKLGSTRLPKNKSLKPTGTLQIESTSAGDFGKGPPKSAWVGLLQIGARTKSAHDTIFLLPFLQEDAALRLPKYGRKRVATGMGKSGVLTPHAAAVHTLVKEGAIGPGDWNGVDARFLKESERYHEAGCFFGFFVVKGKGKPYVNFSCQSLNLSANGEFGPAPLDINKLPSGVRTAWMQHVNLGRALNEAEQELIDAADLHHFIVRLGGPAVPLAFADKIAAVLSELVPEGS